MFVVQPNGLGASRSGDAGGGDRGMPCSLGSSIGRKEAIFGVKNYISKNFRGPCLSL